MLLVHAIEWYKQGENDNGIGLLAQLRKGDIHAWLVNDSHMGAHACLTSSALLLTKCRMQTQINYPDLRTCFQGMHTVLVRHRNVQGLPSTKGQKARGAEVQAQQPLTAAQHKWHASNCVV